MKVSRVNAYSIGFGQVKKSAQKRAIEETHGDSNKLKQVKKLINEQKQNDLYDIVASDSKCFNYEVVKKTGEEEASVFCEDFALACSMAKAWYCYDMKRANFLELSKEFLTDSDD